MHEIFGTYAIFFRANRSPTEIVDGRLYFRLAPELRCAADLFTARGGWGLRVARGSLSACFAMIRFQGYRLALQRDAESTHQSGSAAEWSGACQAHKSLPKLKILLAYSLSGAPSLTDALSRMVRRPALSITPLPNQSL